MGITFARSYRKSLRVWDLVLEQLKWHNENGNNIDGSLMPFNDDRRNGLFLRVYDGDFDKPDRVKDFLYVWTCEAHNSDEIFVCMQTDYPTAHHLYSEEAYDNAKYFHYNEEYKAADYIVKKILEHLKMEY